MEPSQVNRGQYKTGWNRARQVLSDRFKFQMDFIVLCLARHCEVNRLIHGRFSANADTSSNRSQQMASEQFEIEFNCEAILGHCHVFQKRMSH